MKRPLVTRIGEAASAPHQASVTDCHASSYIPVVYCLNKIDSISIEELDLLYRIPNAVPISSEHGWNIDELMEAMWDKLSLKRVYTKPKGKAPDYSAPVVLRATRCTVEDFVSQPPIPFFGLTSIADSASDRDMSRPV